MDGQPSHEGQCPHCKAILNYTVDVSLYNIPFGQFTVSVEAYKTLVIKHGFVQILETWCSKCLTLFKSNPPPPISSISTLAEKE